MPQSRILMSPAEDQSGGGPTEDLVTITRAEFEALRASAAAGPARFVPEEAEAAERARDAAHARELAERDRKAADWEGAFRTALRDRELATALIDRPLVSGAAPQLIRLLREEFDVIEDGGEFKVSDRQGRPVGQAVAERLASPEYAHFRRPPSRGGTATPGASRVARAAEPPAPKTLGEAALARWQEAATRGTPPTAPIGLGRRR